MTRAPITLAVILAALVVARTGAASAEETDVEACYGSELHIVFQNWPELEVVAEFHLPDPSAWLVTPIGAPNTLTLIPCQPEPVHTGRAWGGFTDPRLGHVKFPDVGPGANLAFLAISNYGITPPEDWKSGTINNRRTEGERRDDGFIHIEHRPSGPLGGAWLFPETYLSPIGTPVSMACSLACDIEYLLTERVNLRYSLLVEGHLAPSDFIPIDRIVRDVVLGWLDGGEG